MKPLSELVRALTPAPAAVAGADRVPIRSIATDSRRVEPGALFVALRGTRTDSHEHVGDAVSRGAAAVVVEREIPDPGVPVVRVADARRALAELAAAWYGHPAARLPLVGITGTLGKTSVLAMLESILAAAGRRVGSVGSLGIRVAGETRETGHTVPPPLTLHRAFAAMLDEGAELAAMEVTTHALGQHRVHGLGFALGVFTNLVPMEHMEYHGTFEDYVAVKTRYFEFLRADAPLVYASGDRAVSAQVADRGLRGIGVGRDEGADVRITDVETAPEGSRLRLRVQRPLPPACLPGAREVPAPLELPLRVRMLGRGNLVNAALAATAALCLGAPPEPIGRALAAVEPPRRRMQLLRGRPFTVLDDTVGHPDSVTAVFEVAERLPHRRVHVVFAIRGARGEEVNRQAADTLGIWAARLGVESLLVTDAEDTADARNRVTAAEREAFLDGLRTGGATAELHPRLRDALAAVLPRLHDGDLLLLLGAQGMDAGAALLGELVDGA